MDDFYRWVETSMLAVGLALGLAVTVSSGPAARASAVTAIVLSELSVSADAEAR